MIRPRWKPLFFFSAGFLHGLGRWQTQRMNSCGDSESLLCQPQPGTASEQHPVELVGQGPLPELASDDHPFHSLEIIKVISRRFVCAVAFTSLVTSAAKAAHHEEEAIAPAAKPGQIIVVYDWPCRDTEAAALILKELIAYEVDATPIPYSSVPVIHNAYNVGAVDVHASMDSFEKAGAWQADDAKWQEMIQEMATVCESPVENLSVTVLPTR